MINRKGTDCIYKPGLLCQEGFCGECEISKANSVPERRLNRLISRYEEGTEKANAVKQELLLMAGEIILQEYPELEPAEE